MKSNTNNLFLRLLIIFDVVIMLLIVGGCTVKFVADYDSVTYEEILRVGKEVDKFYGSLLEAPVSSRTYQQYSDKYVEIEAELRSLYTRNKSRPLNEESTEISKSILDLWIKYKNNHAKNNGYKTGSAKLDRNRFIRLFISAASAEAAKKLDPDDKDTKKDSKDVE